MGQTGVHARGARRLVAAATLIAALTVLVGSAGATGTYTDDTRTPPHVADTTRRDAELTGGIRVVATLDDRWQLDVVDAARQPEAVRDRRSGQKEHTAVGDRSPHAARDASAAGQVAEAERVM